MTINSDNSIIGEEINVSIPMYFDYLDISTFPKNAEECKARPVPALPDGYGMTSSIKLREKTSTRSKCLGEYKEGTLVKVLDILPGDPDKWVHVQIGNVTGYMVESYVEYPGTSCYFKLKNSAHLPAAKAKKDIALKQSTGLLANTITELPAGTKMHLLAIHGKWLHVSIPTDPTDNWYMDIQGTDGYVRASDVHTASTFAQLDWID